MIGMGWAEKLIFSWGGNPGVGSLHRFRDAVEHGWPCPLEIEGHSHTGMANRYVAGASNLPFAVLRGYIGTDLPEVTSTIAPITCPFAGEELMAVPSLNPDVGIIHAQRADKKGTVALWGITGIQKEAVLCARRAIVTVEEVVVGFEPRPFQIVLPYVAIDAVDVGMNEENLDEAVTLVLEEAPRDNPRPVDEVGIRELLEDAFVGRPPGIVAERRA
jgi:glutaconate CoA-transferase subunit A